MTEKGSAVFMDAQLTANAMGFLEAQIERAVVEFFRGDDW